MAAAPRQGYLRHRFRAFCASAGRGCTSEIGDSIDSHFAELEPLAFTSCWFHTIRSVGIRLKKRNAANQIVAFGKIVLFFYPSVRTVPAGLIV